MNSRELSEEDVRDPAPLIAELYKINCETERPSSHPPKTVSRDPHLRLRRTLTPASDQFKGLVDGEVHFLVHGSKGRRTPLLFSWEGDDFQMDAYVFGAEEKNATRRILCLHGVSPASGSRERWHQLGERMAALDKDLCFVALDWYALSLSLSLSVYISHLSCFCFCFCFCFC